MQPWGSVVLEPGLASFFCKGLQSKCFSTCFSGSHGLFPTTQLYLGCVQPYT